MKAVVMDCLIEVFNSAIEIIKYFFSKKEGKKNENFNKIHFSH